MRYTLVKLSWESAMLPSRSAIIARNTSFHSELVSSISTLLIFISDNSEWTTKFRWKTVLFPEFKRNITVIHILDIVIYAEKSKIGREQHLGIEKEKRERWRSLAAGAVVSLKQMFEENSTRLSLSLPHFSRAITVSHMTKAEFRRKLVWKINQQQG